MIEALGLYLIGLGHRVAVLTIDPSSSVSGGSILGDKTRMEKLSVHERAFIRPSPSSGTLGGVAEKTREAMLVCEAAGYDVVIAGNRGRGPERDSRGRDDRYVCADATAQRRRRVADHQKGVMELADLVLINKVDIDADAAMRAQAQMTSSLRLLGMHGHPSDPHSAKQRQPQVLQLSALHGTGVEQFWAAVMKFKELRTANGQLAQRRQQQALAWMWERIEAGLKTRLLQPAKVQQHLSSIKAQVLAGRVAPSTAARQLLQIFHASNSMAVDGGASCMSGTQKHVEHAIRTTHQWQHGLACKAD